MYTAQIRFTNTSITSIVLYKQWQKYPAPQPTPASLSLTAASRLSKPPHPLPCTVPTPAWARATRTEQRALGMSLWSCLAFCPTDSSSCTLSKPTFVVAPAATHCIYLSPRSWSQNTRLFFLVQASWVAKPVRSVFKRHLSVHSVW